MLIFRTYACDSGGENPEHTFELMQDRDEGPPKFCPTCGCPVDPDTETVPGTHSIGGSNIVKGVDLTYRLLEESGAERAAITGNPNFKITNMKDHLREGDVAAVLPRNTVTNFMADAEQRGVRYGFGGGAGMGMQTASPTPVPTSGYTGPGHVALSGIQGDSAGSAHLNSRAVMVGAGQINKTGKS